MDPTPLSLTEALRLALVSEVVRALDRTDLFFYRFAANGEVFGAERAAEAWLRDCGFGVGEVQSSRPRLLLLGGIDPPPWGLFANASRLQVDGALVVIDRDAIVIVVREALRAAAQVISG